MDSLEDTVNVLVNGVCTTIVVVVGVILNLIAINIVWKNYERSNIFYRMLIYLLVVDICVLITWINLSLYVAFKIRHPFIMHMVPYFSYPSTHIAITASTFMTVAIAHERYLAVQHPLKYSEGMKSAKSTTNRLRMYLILVILISFGINIPHFIDLEVIYIDPLYYNNNSTIENSTNFNSTSIDIEDVKYDDEFMAPIANITDDTDSVVISNSSDVHLTPFLKYTALGKHPYYLKWYRNFARLFISGLLPFSLLIYFNTIIYKAVKKSTNRRRRLSSHVNMDTQRSIILNDRLANGSNECENNIIKMRQRGRRKSVFTKRIDEENLSMVFVVIVTAFILCHTLKFILNFYEGFMEKVGRTQETRIAGCFSNFLVVLNSSINTIIYCIMNTKFRNYFLDVIKWMLPCVKKPESKPILPSQTLAFNRQQQYGNERAATIEMKNADGTCDTAL